MGLLVILIGLRNILVPTRLKILPVQPKRDWFIFVIYLSAILFVGLWPKEYAVAYQNDLLSTNSFGKKDFAFNLAGFIPLGFLVLPLVRYKIDNNEIIKLVAIGTTLGFSVSLVIEVLQYLWIPGRYSTAYDLATNTIGAFIGALCYVNLWGSSNRM